jgi:hypothetical protein
MIIVPDRVFLERFISEVVEATGRVTEQTASGENQFLPIFAMFPHGPQDLLGTIFTKSARAVGYEMAGNLDKVYAEAQDILNYAGFLLAYLKITNLESPLLQEKPNDLPIPTDQHNPA